MPKGEKDGFLKLKAGSKILMAVSNLRNYLCLSIYSLPLYHIQVVLSSVIFHEDAQDLF